MSVNTVEAWNYDHSDAERAAINAKLGDLAAAGKIPNCTQVQVPQNDLANVPDSIKATWPNGIKTENGNPVQTVTAVQFPPGVETPGSELGQVLVQYTFVDAAAAQEYLDFINQFAPTIARIQ